MFANSFILVLLDFVWYCYFQLSAIPFSFLIYQIFVCYFWVGMFLVDVNRVEQGGRCFRLELLSALVFFILLLSCLFYILWFDYRYAFLYKWAFLRYFDLSIRFVSPVLFLFPSQFVMLESMYVW